MKQVTIYSAKSDVKAMAIKNLLADNTISFTEIDKRDTSYANLFGNIEISVDETDAEKAQSLIEELQFEE
ncbi:putative signal transducing protein [Mangrovimonas sp. YM274]|uniref:putative signal transducing protein n=1 Tax=Mangrovimonas sp. YM274 TaxID=3070660 RepID=UPI0027DADD0C|nr:DUF2007 domain-containing protein [Mangrovimonas sp. YM274]WMI68029.1 DUF2007 domain-containing protein [Mangrovimonas sp. YM274]